MLQEMGFRQRVLYKGLQGNRIHSLVVHALTLGCRSGSEIGNCSLNSPASPGHYGLLCIPKCVLALACSKGHSNESVIPGRCAEASQKIAGSEQLLHLPNSGSTCWA